VLSQHRGDEEEGWAPSPAVHHREARVAGSVPRLSLGPPPAAEAEAFTSQTAANTGTLGAYYFFFFTTVGEDDDSSLAISIV